MGISTHPFRTSRLAAGAALAVTAALTVSAAPTAHGATTAEEDTSQIAWHGWSSGASGNGVADGTFAAWRGSPVTGASTWADTDEENQIKVWSLTSEYANFDGDIDIATGGTVLGSGESYAQAASGAFDDRWTQQSKNIAAARGDATGLTYVRPFHEFNGNWYGEWFVTPSNVEDYKRAFQRRVVNLREHFPQVVIVWSPNDGTSGGGAAPADSYPGDEYVDVIGVDSYNANGNPVVTSAAKWSEYANQGDATFPRGVETWRQFAEARGKPMSLPEWGLRCEGGGGDNPAYIQGMHDWIAANAARPGESDVAGKVVYDAYFNVNHGGSDCFLIKDGQHPESSALYKSLTWGNSTDAPTTPGEEPTEEPSTPPTDEPTTPGEEPTEEPSTPPTDEPTTPGEEPTEEPTVTPEPEQPTTTPAPDTEEEEVVPPRRGDCRHHWTPHRHQGRQHGSRHHRSR